MKKLKILLSIIFILPCFMLLGCTQTQDKYVTNITQSGGVDSSIYTVYYSDGSSSYITVKNGKDGSDLTIDQIKAYCEENSIDFESFLQEYLDINYNPVQTATNKALRSAVSIFTVAPYSFTNSTYKSLSAGAGVIYQINDDYSYILTNYHVVASDTTANGIASEIKLFQYGADTRITPNEPYITSFSGNSYYYSSYTFSNSAISALYVGGSEEYDIAILKINTDNLADFACAVTVAKDYSVGETAIAVGNPNGEGTSVTQGIVSVESEEIAFSETEIYRVMRIDTAVNGGNSGGGLFNLDGDLIGIVNAKIEDETIDNIAYAIPYDNVTKVADNLIYYHEQTNTVAKVKRLNLNFFYKIENDKATYNPTTQTFTITDDIVVISTISNGFGSILQLQANDIIKSIQINNNEPIEITRGFQFIDLLLTVREGDKILLTVQRGNDLVTIGSSLISVTNQHLETCD